MDSPLSVVVLFAALLVLLDLAALRWGVDSRDGARLDSQGRFPTVIDPFFTELAGRHRQSQLLAEAAHERLIAEARRGRLAAPVRPSLPVRTTALAHTAWSARRALLSAAGAVLIAAGTRLKEKGSPA